MTHLNSDITLAIRGDLITAQNFHKLGIWLETSADTQLILASLLALVRENRNDLNSIGSLAGSVRRGIKVKLLAVLNIAAVNLDGMVSKGVQSSSQLVEGRCGVVIGGPNGFAIVGRVVACFGG